jgi:hypothetical protein
LVKKQIAKEDERTSIGTYPHLQMSDELRVDILGGPRECFGSDRLAGVRHEEAPHLIKAGLHALPKKHSTCIPVVDFGLNVYQEIHDILVLIRIRTSD